MIFQRALLREFGNLAVAVFATLFAITITTQLIRLLGQAAGGKVLSEGVLALLAFSSLNYLPVLLSLTVFVTVLMAVSRSYRDSEMVIWMGSGLSLLAWVRPVLVFASPIVGLVAVLSLFLSPWAVERSDDYRRQMENRDEAARVAPGVFREAAGADRVFFVESVAGNESAVQNIFVAQNEKGRLNIMVARRGERESTVNGDRFVVLLNGSRYEGTPGEADYRVLDFERYWLRIDTREQPAEKGSTKAANTADLVRAGTNGAQAELLWRVGLPLSAMVLALLAIPLAFVNPRASRSVNLVFALLTYMVYSNLISMAQAWVAQGKVQFVWGWWVVHAAMAAILALLFWQRMRVGSVIRR